jgi:hypothetical protein
VQRAVARTVLSTIDDAGALDRMWDDLESVLRARRPARLDEDALLRSVAGHAAHWYADRRASQAGWSYPDTDELTGRLRRMLLDKVQGRSGDQTRTEFQDVARRLCARDYNPYPACGVVCTQAAPVCLYRSAVADLVATGRFQASWREADGNDARSAEGGRPQTWAICQDAGYELVEFPEPDWPAETKQTVTDTARRVCLCFEQQMLADDRRKVPRTARLVMKQVLRQAGLQ